MAMFSSVHSVAKTGAKTVFRLSVLWQDEKLSKVHVLWLKNKFGVFNILFLLHAINMALFLLHRLTNRSPLLFILLATCRCEKI